MAGWCIQLLVVSFVLLLSASPADAYQLDQFYSFNVTEDQAVVEPAFSTVQLNSTFRFNAAIKSYIRVSQDVHSVHPRRARNGNVISFAERSVSIFYKLIAETGIWNAEERCIP